MKKLINIIYEKRKMKTTNAKDAYCLDSQLSGKINLLTRSELKKTIRLEQKTNKMRKLILIAVIVMYSFNSYSYILLRRTTSGGIFGLYGSTNKELVTYGEYYANGSPKMGWVIDCKGVGLTTCPNASVLKLPVTGRPDAVDLTEVNNLLQYADDQIESSNAPHSGTKVTRVRVNGEDTERVYTLSWIVNENGSTETNIDLEEVKL